MMRPGLVLDHVGVLVSNLESASHAYENLGFRMTAQSSHEGPLRPGGPVEIWGTGNSCAMFRQGYLELLGITDPNRYHDHVRDRLARYEGLHLVALGCQDVGALRADWIEKVEALRPIAEVARSVPQSGGGNLPAQFRILYLDDYIPEAQVFAIQHLNPEALWQAPLLDHPNGVTALLGATIVCDDPEATAGRFSRLGLETMCSEDAWRVSLSRNGYLSIISPEAVSNRFPGSTPPAIPSVIAATFEVADLSDTAKYLASADLSMLEGEGRIQVAANDALGCVIEFVNPNTERFSR